MNRAIFLLYKSALGGLHRLFEFDPPRGRLRFRMGSFGRPLLSDDRGSNGKPQGMAAYYVGLLRANGGRSKHCAAGPT